MTNQKVSSSDGVQLLLTKSRSDLLGTDEHFVIEIGLLHMLSGVGASARCKAMLLQAFPCKARAVSETVAMARVQAMISSDGFKYLPPTEQASIKYTATLITAIEHETTRELKLTNVSQTLVEVWQAASHFCRFEGPINKGAEPAEHSGEDAVQALMFYVLEAKKDVDTAAECIKLAKYSFAVAAATKPVLDKLLTGRSVPKAKAAPKGGSAAASSSSSKPSGAASSKPAVDAATAAAAGMFA